MSTPRAIDLSAPPQGLGVLAFRGPDAARFLQGQFSAEVEKLAIGGSTLAGLHNPQGRVIALLVLARTTTDELFAVLPHELVAPVAQRLGKYVLRAKVRIADESENLHILGFPAGSAPAGGIALDWFGRHLLLSPAARVADFALEESRARWERADVEAGVPQVYANTSETFVAQMLNLDLLGAIAFDKGCYTGQEVIARAHYRGRVKRRLQRWRTADGAQLRPGDSARGPDGRALVVVRVAPLEAGGQEVLAVGKFSAAPEDVAAPADPGDGAGVALEGPLPLPYSLPE
jgi:folate-binding protein YgfZ